MPEQELEQVPKQVLPPEADLSKQNPKQNPSSPSSSTRRVNSPIHPTSSTSTREQDHDMDGRPAIIEGWPKVAGYCPACGTSSLFLGSGGWVTCSLDKCPNPTAAADVLDEPEIEHIVELGEATFSIQHPLRERLNGLLFRCDLHERLSACDGPPAKPGTYRVRVGERMHWEAISRG